MRTTHRFQSTFREVKRSVYHGPVDGSHSPSTLQGATRSALVVMGRVLIRNYDKDGATRYVTEILA